MTASESDAQVQYDADSLNPHYSYSDEQNHVHEVWLLDGVTAYNELRAAERAGVRGTALWRLGTEDPSLWSIWDLTQPDEASRAQAGGDASGLRSDPRRGRRHLAHHGDAAEGPADVSLRRREPATHRATKTT